LSFQETQDRLEHLRRVEALLGAAPHQVFYRAYGDPWHFPAQVKRFDGSHVSLTEADVDRAAELIASVSEPLRHEICRLMGQPREAVNRTYHVCALMPRDGSEPIDESYRVEPKRRASRTATTSRPTPSNNSTGRAREASCR
jgi:hypothetical protein